MPLDNDWKWKLLGLVLVAFSALVVMTAIYCIYVWVKG